MNVTLGFVDAYGIPVDGLTGLSTLDNGDNFQFEITEAQLQTDQSQTIYLPMIVK